MKLNSNTCPACSRREMLKVGALAAIPFMSPSAVHGFLNQEPIAANGSPEPYPIPWLDKNGSHNQPAGPNLEPSHLPFQRKSSPLQHLHRHGHRQPGKSHPIWRQDHRLRRHGRRLLGRSHHAARNIHSHMTHALPGTVCPRESDPRFSPAHFPLRTLLDRSCSGRRPDHQPGRKHFHA